MKKLLNIAIIALSMVQANNIFSADTPPKGWIDWARWKLGLQQGPLVEEQKQKLKKESNERFVKAMGASALAGGVAAFAASDVQQTEGLGQNLVKVLGIEAISSNKAMMLGTGALTFTLVWGVYYTKELIQGFLQRKLPRERAIQEVKKNIEELLKNTTLYPTRSSKMNMLIQRDEFQQYIQDEDNIVKDACAQLLAAMNETEPTLKPGDFGYAEQIGIYAQEKQLIANAEAADKPINDYMMKLKAQIFHLPLQDQINALEGIKNRTKFTIPEAQAWMSLYYRSKSKLEVEKQLNLTPKEKSERDLWKEGEKVLVSSEAFKLVHEKHLESMKSINELTKKITETQRSLFKKQEELEKASGPKDGESYSSKQAIQEEINGIKGEIEKLTQERDTIIKHKQAEREAKSKDRIEAAQQKEKEEAQTAGREVKEIRRFSQQDFDQYQKELEERKKGWESERKFQGMTTQQLEQYKKEQDERVKRNLRKAAMQNIE